MLSRPVIVIGKYGQMFQQPDPIVSQGIYDGYINLRRSTSPSALLTRRMHVSHQGLEGGESEIRCTMLNSKYDQVCQGPSELRRSQLSEFDSTCYEGSSILKCSTPVQLSKSATNCCLDVNCEHRRLPPIVLPSKTDANSFRCTGQTRIRRSPTVRSSLASTEFDSSEYTQDDSVKLIDATYGIS